VDRGPEETLRTAVKLLRRGGAIVDDDWIILMLLDRVEAAQSQTDLMLRAADDLAQANIALRRESDQLRTALRGARNALVGIAMCDDPMQAREIADAYVTALEPDDVDGMVPADCLAE
jgi:hypothetical protein